MHHTHMTKIWGKILLLGMCFLPLSGTGQGIQQGLSKGVFNSARLAKEMAVVPAVEKSLMHRFSMPAVPPDIGTPLTKTALTQLVAKQVPFHVENKLLDIHVKKTLYTLPEDKLGGVFLARPTGWKTGQNAFSGTIIKTEYKGQEEIYGVVAAHTLATHPGDPSLQRLFTADIYVNGQFVPAQAEIVQISAPNHLDLALVKFQSRTERHFHPFELNDEEPSFGKIFQTLGFGGQFVIHLTDRSLLSKNSLYLRANMELDPYHRRGLCGAPLFDENGKLIGFHTGSVVGGLGEPNYVGYATQARFVNTLVEAHHNGGKATVPFELNGQKIVDLDINEYVSYIELVDSNGEVLWEREVRSKFPYRQTEKMIREMQPRYIDLVTSLVDWDGNHLTSRTKNKFGAVSYHYDIQTQKLQTLTKQ